MSTAQPPSTNVNEDSAALPGPSLVDKLLESQQQLTAVERFSQRHQSVTTPMLESRYRDLIPHDLPDEDEQYSFEVDLDACSGCKACVAACHNLNGLEDGELWRNVGLLVGGSEPEPVIQHVTAACHHCLEPACMHGCPVNAYEKDPITGIVAHLDDQCIGCKYCMFMCPYDVPVYSPSKGIVRKCNMCTDRLAVGEAPACVKACPNEAIKIRKVKRSEIIDGSETEQLVPGAPDVAVTLPTTRYKTNRVLPRNLLPDDYYIAKPLHAHFPLVFMLTLTQMAFGIFAINYFLPMVWPELKRIAFVQLDIFGFGVLVAGLNVAILHLGRPLKAYRAMAGIRTSWLSREIAAFNLFAGQASALLLWGWFEFPEAWTGIGRGFFGFATLVAGAIAVACSAMLYIVTKRPLWTAFRTSSHFFLSGAVLGTAFVIAVLPWVADGWVLQDTPTAANGQTVGSAMAGLSKLLIVFVVIKLIIEASVFTHLKSLQFTPWRHAANLMVGDMKWQVLIRFGLGVMAGIVLPLLLLVETSGSEATTLPGRVTVLAMAIALTLLVAELLERYLFFSVSVARRMPGAPN